MELFFSIFHLPRTPIRNRNGARYRERRNDTNLYAGGGSTITYDDFKVNELESINKETKYDFNRKGSELQLI